MGLTKIKTIGYGLDGKTLDLTIAIPKDSYLDHFYVANQNDIPENGETSVGIDYIKAVKSAAGGTITDKEAFLKLFTFIEDIVDKEEGNTYSIYKLNQQTAWLSIEPSKTGIGITVSQNDLTFLTFKVHPVVSEDFTYSDACGEDNTVTVFPLYNLLILRLRALSAAKFVNCSCDLPDEFIDKILQLKAIQLANTSGDYYRAATYWNKFYKGRNIATSKRCGCHG